MAIHWQVKFRSLRADTLYTVNIYDDNYNGNAPVQLTGAEQPFTTEEDDDDDFFIPVRTQSGYIRIVTDWSDAQIEELLPATQIDRYVTLTHQEGQTLITDWQGYMQPQCFGFPMYGSPREIKLPVQCVLTSMQGQYVSSEFINKMRTFGYYIATALSSVYCNIDKVFFQSSCAIDWLKLTIDHRMLLEETDNYDLRGKFSHYDIIKDIAEFFGWTVRIVGVSVYFLSPDEFNNQDIVEITVNELLNIDNNPTYSIVNYNIANLNQTSFASDEQELSLIRAANNVVVSASCQTDKDILYFRDKFIDKLKEHINQYHDFDQYGDLVVFYSENCYIDYTDKYISYNTFLDQVLYSTYASYNFMKILTVDDFFDGGSPSGSDFAALRIKKSFNASNWTPYATITSKFPISLSNCGSDDRFSPKTGFLRMTGSIYQKGKRISDANSYDVGKKSMYICLGITDSNDNTKWFSSATGQWQTTKNRIEVRIGQSSEYWQFKIRTNGTRSFIPVPDDMPLVGKISLEFYGSDNIGEVDGERIFDIKEPAVLFENAQTTRFVTYFLATGLTENNIKNSFNYEARPNDAVREQKEISPIFISYNRFPFAKNIIMNSDGVYQWGIPYNPRDLTELTHPEQHLADRISAFWTNARHQMKTEYILNGNTVATPLKIFTKGNSHYYPMAISHQWRDDIIQYTLIEV